MVMGKTKSRDGESDQGDADDAVSEEDDKQATSDFDGGTAKFQDILM